MAVIYTPSYIQFLDDDGTPLAGGKVYTYAAGTDTPKATYTDQSEGTELDNPVTLDSAGRAVIWINGAYKFVVADADDNIIRTVDNQTSFSTSGTDIDAILPDQAGNSGKYLTTNGTVSSWAAFTSASQAEIVAGTAGELVDAAGLNDFIPTNSATVTISGSPTSQTIASDLSQYVTSFTVSLSGISTNGTSALLLQLGDSGGLENSGYTAGYGYASSSAGALGGTSTAGFPIYTGAAADTLNGAIRFTLVDPSTNTWAANGSIVAKGSTDRVMAIGGVKSLSGVLTQVALVTQASETLDAGGKLGFQYSFGA